MDGACSIVGCAVVRSTWGGPRFASRRRAASPKKCLGRSAVHTGIAVPIFAGYPEQRVHSISQLVTHDCCFFFDFFFFFFFDLSPSFPPFGGVWDTGDNAAPWPGDGVSVVQQDAKVQIATPIKRSEVQRAEGSKSTRMGDVKCS